MPLATYNKRLIDMAPKAIEHTSNMVAYWDKDLICRFANGAYFKWFGIRPEDMIDKIHIKDLLGHLFEKNLKYINGVLAGKVQVFEKMIDTPDGMVRNTRAIYTPEIIDNIVCGFYAYVSDIDPIDIDGIGTVPFGQCHTSNPSDQLLYDVEQELKSNLLKGFPGLSAIAKNHNVSESKLKRDFKKKHNKSIFLFYRHLQMEFAESYIKDKIYTKNQLAMMLNFSNPSNFSSCYNKYLGNSKKKLVDHNIKDKPEQLYDFFKTKSMVSMAILDKNLCFWDATEKWKLVHGLKNIELFGEHIHEVQPTSDNLKNSLAKCLAGAEYEGEEYYLGENGSPYWLRWNISPWYAANEEIKGLLIITEDITHTKKDQKDQDIEILSRASEISRVGTWTRSFVDGTAFWSKISKEIFEVPTDFIPELETVMSFYKNDNDRIIAETTLASILETGKPYDIQLDILTHKGNTKTIRVIGYPDFSNGKCVKVSGTFQEITKI
ncbi:MAG: PAS domain S-box protein [Pedobacter sp.]|nr:MAG: PAS domain S-box protein [Pedobacter sp.]